LAESLRLPPARLLPWAFDFHLPLAASRRLHKASSLLQVERNPSLSHKTRKRNEYVRTYVRTYYGSTDKRGNEGRKWHWNVGIQLVTATVTTDGTTTCVRQLLPQMLRAMLLCASLCHNARTFVGRLRAREIRTYVGSPVARSSGAAGVASGTGSYESNWLGQVRRRMAQQLTYVRHLLPQKLRQRSPTVPTHLRTLRRLCRPLCADCADPFRLIVPTVPTPLRTLCRLCRPLCADCADPLRRMYRDLWADCADCADSFAHAVPTVPTPLRRLCRLS
jgi:hypothetical protein